METAYVLVQCKIAHEMEVLKALLEIDLVKEAKGTFGYYDIFTKIQGESSSEIEDIITKKYVISKMLPPPLHYLLFQNRILRNE